MRTSTSGCTAVKPRRRGISHSEAKPLVVVTVRCGRGAVGAQPVGHGLQPFEQVGGSPVERATLVGEQQRPVSALEQGDAQMLLQAADLPADGRLGDEQLFGGLGEGQVAGGRLEALDQVQRGQIEALLLHYTSSCMK